MAVELATIRPADGFEPDPDVVRLRALVDVAALVNVGYDPEREVLAPDTDHPLLGFAVCVVANCTTVAVSVNGLCGPCWRRWRARRGPPGTGVQADYEVYHPGSNWFLYYDGVPIGYYPDSLFYGNLAHGTDIVEGYGEAATVNPDGACTQMGNGVNASSNSSATLNAFEGVASNGSLVVDNYGNGPGYFGNAYSYGLRLTGAGSAYYGGTGPGPGPC